MNDQPQVTKMVRVLVGRAALILIGITLALGTVEMLLRLWSPRMIGSFQGLYALDEDIGYKMKPHLDVTYTTSAYTTRVRANALGFRDEDYPVERTPASFRIVVLGDSLVEALQVPANQTFHKRLEARLNERSTQRSYEVLSMAVGGFGLIQEYAAWWHYGRRFHPDLLILVVCPNDIEPDLNGLSAPLSYDQLQHSGQAASALKRRLADIMNSSPIERFYRSLHLYVFLRNALQRAPAGEAVFRWARRIVNPVAEHPMRIAEQTDLAEPWFQLVGRGVLPTTQQGWWDGAIEVITALHREAAAHGSRLFVVIAPHGDQLDSQRLMNRMKLLGFDLSMIDAERPDRLLAEALQARGVDCMALIPYLRQETEPLYVDNGWHWNVQGHRAVAEAILARLGTTLDVEAHRMGLPISPLAVPLSTTPH